MENFIKIDSLYHTPEIVRQDILKYSLANFLNQITYFLFRGLVATENLSPISLGLQLYIL
jgi:hypothetical protein